MTEAVSIIGASALFVITVPLALQLVLFALGNPITLGLFLVAALLVYFN